MMSLNENKHLGIFSLYSSLIKHIQIAASPSSHYPLLIHLPFPPDLLLLHFPSEKARPPRDINQT